MNFERRKYSFQLSFALAASTGVLLSVLLLVLGLSGCGSGGEKGAVPPILYLGWDEQDLSQIYRQINGKNAEQITNAADGVFDFALAPDGKALAYSSMADNGTSEIWLTDKNGSIPRLLITCIKAECNQVVWSPDNRRLIYERRNIGEDGIPGSPYLWWLDSETGETEAVLENSEERGIGVRFSADGQWLSYVSPEEEGTVVYNMQDGRLLSVAEGIGAPAEWSPTSEQLVVPNLDLVIFHGSEGDDHLEHTHEYELATHLFSMDIESGALLNISGDRKVEDSVPAWSPDGEWIAFGRRSPGTSAGRQIWLVRADGSEARALTEDQEINYGPPIWSPSGQHLLFQRYALNEQDGEPGVWLLDIETGSVTELATVGMQPIWLVDETGN